MKQLIQIEGYTPEQVPALPDHHMDALVVCGEPLVFRIGTAQILGKFRIRETILEIELAQIDGGGEGVLPTLWLLSERYAERRGLEGIDWIVHALTCARPNLKLRRILELKGFRIETVNRVQAYCLKRRKAAQPGATDNPVSAPRNLR